MADAPLIIERDNLAGVSPQVTNIVLTLANTEYYFDIPENSRQFAFKTRNPNHKLQFSFEENTSGTVYITLNALSYDEPAVLSRSLRIYCQSPEAECTIELITWS